MIAGSVWYQFELHTSHKTWLLDEISMRILYPTDITYFTTGFTAAGLPKDSWTECQYVLLEYFYF